MAERDALSAIAMVGRTLSPFYLYDPLLDEDVVAPAYAALVAIEPAEAARQWPFTPVDVADKAFRLMTDDLSMEGLAREYRRLFIGPGPKAAAPWGSVYTDRDQVFFGITTLELRDWLYKHHIQVKKGESPRIEPLSLTI